MNEKILILFLTCVTSLPSTAQKKTKGAKDSLAVLREFVMVCNAYKQVPMYMKLEYRTTSNIIQADDDTATTYAEFYLTASHTYLRFGETEQLTDDSLMLMISDKMQRMILQTNINPVSTRLKDMMGIGLPDSSIANLSKKYTAALLQAGKPDGGEKNGNRSVLEVTSRALFSGAEIPKEQIRIEYHSNSKTPYRIIQIRRSLVRIDEEDDGVTPLSSDKENLSNGEGQLKLPLITIPGTGRFLIKEQSTLFIYKKIEYGKSVQTPVKIKDRLVKNDMNEYVPAKGYEHYLVSEF